MRKLLLLSLFWAWLVPVAIAQQQVTGTVTDYSTNEPLPGVNILLQNTTNGTITDLDGNFTLEVSGPDAVLVFSFIGYETQEIPVGNQANISVQLMPDLTTLSEVVVVGYGSMERQNVTGAISSISGDEIAKVPVPNMIEAMRGQVPGLRITRDNGQPGSGVSFSIRGENSLTLSNEPLIVIDGVPNTGGNLSEINPADIASVDVLKDAASASIYGSSGANGVILITTKRGKAGKPTVAVEASTGIAELSMTPRMFNADEFVQLKRDAAEGAGRPSGINDVLTDPIERQNYIDGKSVDWHDELLRTGTINNVGVSISGGTEKLRVYVNGDAYLEKGIVEKSDYKRYSLRLNTDYEPFDFLKIGANVQLTKSDADETGNTLDQDENADFNDFVGNTPLGRTHDDEGNLVPTVKGDQFQYNPLFRYANSQVDRARTRVYINPYLEFKIINGLTYRLNTFAEQRDEKFNRFLSGPYNQSNKNFMRIQTAQNTTYLVDNILNYSKEISSRSRIDATLVYGFQKMEGYTLNTIAEGDDDDLLGYNGIDIPPSERSRIGYDLGNWAKEYYVARLQYGFDDRYIMTATIRRDGSSRFGENYKYGNFPSVSGAWNISNERFLENNNIINNLKFRISYGLIGNDLLDDDYGYLARAQPVTYADNSGLNSGYTTGANAPNADLRWEESNQFNTGIDFGLLNNRITGSFDYYMTKTKDLLLEESIPSTTGYNRVFSNIGRSENWGIDANVTGQVLTGPFTWEVSANASMNRNEIVSLSRLNVDENGEPVHDYANNWFIGEQIGTIYGYIFDGIYQLGQESEAAAMHPTYANYGAGDPIIRDISGPEGIPDGVITSDDQTFLGSSNPTWYGGLKNTIGYKGFELSVLFEIVQGVEKINYYYGSMTGRDNTIAVDYWTPENPSNVFPQPHETDTYYFADAVRLRDASFISLRNVSLSYTLPANLLERTPLESVSLYVRGNNLHYFTDYEDSYSPEVNAFNFPIQKIWTFGTRIVL